MQENNNNWNQVSYIRWFVSVYNMRESADDKTDLGISGYACESIISEFSKRFLPSTHLVQHTHTHTYLCNIVRYTPQH